MPAIPTDYLYSVAMFVTPDGDGLRYSGTGFFCRYRWGFQNAFDGLFLVTSAAAIREDLPDMELVCSRRRSKRPRWYPATGEGSLALGTWITDLELDLAILRLDRERLAADGVRYRGFDAEFRVLTIADLKKRRIGEGDDVRILGFPPALLGRPLEPMVRRGIVARIQDCYRGRSSTFLLDATICEGNRGSPVILRPERGVDGRPLDQPPVNLLGIVSGNLLSDGAPLSLEVEGRTLLVRPHTGLVRVVPVDALVGLLRSVAEESGA